MDLSLLLVLTSEDLDTLDAASSSHFHHDTITEHAGMAISFKDGENEEEGIAALAMTTTKSALAENQTMIGGDQIFLHFQW